MIFWASVTKSANKEQTAIPTVLAQIKLWISAATFSDKKAADNKTRQMLHWERKKQGNLKK